MVSDIFPLPAILFQCLFLLVSIATESSFFYHFLKLSRKNSVEYSTIVNLLANFHGWLLFFIFLKLIDQSIEKDLINYFFFNQISNALLSWSILVGSFIFFMLFIIKLLGLIVLDTIQEKTRVEKLIDVSLDRHSLTTDTSRARVMLFAHTCSLSLILLILLIIIIHLQFVK